MSINPSNLRKNIYRALDQVLRTGKPVEIIRKGKRLKVVREIPKGGKLARLVPHDCIRGNPEALVHLDWSKEWKGDQIH